jgi:ABC-type Na+ transport system ATPase subunit NatA
MIEGLKGIMSGDVLVDSLHVVHYERQVKSIIGVQLQASPFPVWPKR